jgi:glutathione S-transferase
MQLVGQLDSPFVRRVAISARLLGIQLDRNPLSIFSSYDEFRQLNPLAKVPTLVCDDSTQLVDSTLIIDYLESMSGTSLLPRQPDQRQLALRYVGIALVAMEKAVQLIYELKQRPAQIQYEPWINRVSEQLVSAVVLMAQSLGDGQSWLVDETLTQADISTAVAWAFIQHAHPELAPAEQYPGLAGFSLRAESLPAFRAYPITAG